MYARAQRSNIFWRPVNWTLLTYGAALLWEAKGTAGVEELMIKFRYSVVHGEGGIGAERTLETHCIAHFVICRHKLNDFFHCLFETFFWQLAEVVSNIALFLFGLLYVG